MSFLTSYEGIHRIQLDTAGDYYIDVREHVSFIDREAAEKALSEMHVEGTRVTPSPDVMKYRRLLVLAHVKEWNLDDEDGAVWPIDFECVGKLPDVVFDQVWKHIDTNSPKRDKAEQRRFPDGLDERDQVRKPRARKLAEVPA